VPLCQHCNSYVKPDIVFFGEQLPPVFHKSLRPDLKRADLCLILGTSLMVPPVAYIPQQVNCKRILLNRELVGNIDPENNETDLFYSGDCDEAATKLARLLGWEEELLELHQKVRRQRSDGSEATTQGETDEEDTPTIAAAAAASSSALNEETETEENGKDHQK